MSALDEARKLTTARKKPNPAPSESASIEGSMAQFESIEKIAVTESKKLLQEISLFDVYKGDKMEKGKKSYAVSFVFQHPEKTLTDAEIEKVMSKLMNKYETELGAVIRKS